MSFLTCSLHQEIPNQVQNDRNGWWNIQHLFVPLHEGDPKGGRNDK